MDTLDHKHMLVFAYVQKPPKVVEQLEDWFRRLVDAVGMKVLIEPKCVYCDTAGNEGITGTVCIETSHASIHFWEKHDRNPEFSCVQFDLYSCKDYDPQTVINMIAEFGIIDYQYMIIDRNADFQVSQQTFLRDVSEYRKKSA